MKRQRRMRTLAVLLLSLLLCSFFSACVPFETHVPMIAAYGKVQYDAWILECTNEGTLPDGFVHLEKLEHLGELLLFRWEDTQIRNDHKKYCYLFEDSYTQGQDLILIIEHDVTPQSSTATILENIDGAANRYQIPSEDEEAVYNLGQYQYRYKRGQLQEIVWYIGDIQFSLSSNSYQTCIEKSIKNPYQEGITDTYLARILSIDEAVANAAFAEITEKLSK